MFCPQCGKEIPKGVTYYTCECGRKIKVISKAEADAKKSNPQPQVKYNNPAVNLKNYNQTCNCTCLECGYSGLMGGVSYENNFFVRIILPIIIFGICIYLSTQLLLFGGTLFAVIGIAAAAFSGYLFVMLLKKLGGKKLFCPNCKRIIQTRQ